MQSPEGFLKAGGFRGVYRGLGSVAIGSAPCSALFFATYDSTRRHLQETSLKDTHSANMIASILGEVAACLVRVPTDNVKMRMQTGRYNGLREAFRAVCEGNEANVRHVPQVPRASTPTVATSLSGLYKGYISTLFRDVPFGMIQYPLYEALKTRAFKTINARNGSNDSSQKNATLLSVASAVCGALSGAFAAFLTCPLDVVKTRFQLGVDPQGRPYVGLWSTLKRVFAEGMTNTPHAPVWGGLRLMFRGAVPRVTWISIGGCFFFGAFEGAKCALERLESHQRSTK